MIVSPPRATYRQNYAARIALSILFLSVDPLAHVRS
jgi:hypothetical protein